MIYAALLAFAAAPSPTSEGTAFFEAKVRPVLIRHCYECHSEDARKARKLRGGLLLDSRRGIREGGDSGPALVPGKSADSLIVKAMRGHTSQMPPKGKLGDDLIADIARWVDLGAPDPRDGAVLTAKRNIDLDAGKRFWSLRPLHVTTPPNVKNNSWIRTPIDRFILSQIEARGLFPAAPLAKEKLLRRVTFDLTGLPPTPEEIKTFMHDTSPDAYPRLIDRLLASDRYGERWGRHWLDIARFAESGGYEFDGDRPGAYHYRDFIIKALNADMPFDEFVRLQLAGDELKPGDLTATSATGFLVAGPYPGQTTAKTLEPIRYDHLDDMISTIGTGLLGLSLGCARCHEHKYDPIPQQDYYRLIANLARTDSTRRQMDPDPEAFRQRKAAFDTAHAPFVTARDRFAKEQLPAKVAQWLAQQPKSAATWLTLDTINVAPQPKTLTLTGRTSLKGLTAIRLEGPGVHDATFNVTAAPLTGNPVAVKLKPVRDGVALAETPFGFDGETKLTVNVKGNAALSRVRVAISTQSLPSVDAPSVPQLQSEIATRIAAKDMLGALNWFRVVDADADKVLSALEASAKNEPKPPAVEVFAATSGRGGDVHYLIRGETEKKNGVARPGFAQVLMSTPEEAARWHRNGKEAPTPRVALALWITDANHGAGHLLARVMVNRLWQHHFGKGIVRTPNDFGAQGDAPTHPELLDWLASELIAGGWKLKRIHKLLVSSAVYLQSGEVSATASKTDPRNLFWSFLPARRLEAEAIRDSLLAVGGSIDAKMFGVGTLDENSTRRSVYLTVKRTRLIPMLQAFDAPEAIQSVGERSVTTTTTQALAMMNSPFVRRQAELLAARVKSERPEASVEAAYLYALGRRPSEGETQRMTGMIRRLIDETKTPAAAMVDFCQVLLCVNEFITID